jgi:hypothetical protein
LARLRVVARRTLIGGADLALDHGIDLFDGEPVTESDSLDVMPVTELGDDAVLPAQVSIRAVRIHAIKLPVAG